MGGEELITADRRRRSIQGGDNGRRLEFQLQLSLNGDPIR
jgi:hypothetical protein